MCSSETRGNCEALAVIPLYVIVCIYSCIEMSMQLSIFRNMGVSWGQPEGCCTDALIHLIDRVSWGHQRGVVQMYSFI